MAAAVLRESLMLGGRACRPLVAADGLSAAFIDPALERLSGAGCRIRFNRRLRTIELEFGTRRGAGFRRRQDRHWARRRRRARRAGAGSLLPVAGDHRARRIPRHRQCAFPHRTTAGPAADPGGDQRHGGMAVCLRGPAFGHHQRRRPADRYRPRGAGPRSLGRGRQAHRPAGGTCRPGRSSRSGARPMPLCRPRRPSGRRRRHAGANLVLAGDWTRTGLPATIEGSIRSGNKAAEQLRQAGF